MGMVGLSPALVSTVSGRVSATVHTASRRECPRRADAA